MLGSLHPVEHLLRGSPSWGILSGPWSCAGLLSFPGGPAGHCGAGCWGLALLIVPSSLQTDVLKCVVSTDPSLHSHWLVAALCNFGRFLKAAFFVLLPER